MIDNTLVERANEVAEEKKDWAYIRKISAAGEELDLDSVVMDSSDLSIYDELKSNFGIESFDDLVRALIEADATDEATLEKMAETSNIRMVITCEFELDKKRLAIDIDVDAFER